VEANLDRSRIIIDVSHTFRSAYRTGIQRVVREFGSNVEQESNCYIAWFPNFLKVYFIELRQTDIRSDRSQRPTGDIKKKLDKYSSKVISNFYLLRTLMIYLHEILLFAKILSSPSNYRIHKIRPGDKILLIDAFWADPRFKRKLERFENLDLRIYLFVHDLFPVSNPEWFNKRQITQFRKSMKKAFQVSHTVICASEFVKSEILKLFPMQITSIDKILTVKLACSNLEVETDKVNRDGIVVLGTIEPRKNVSLILDWIEAFNPKEKVWFIGRKGWESPQTFIRMDKLALKGKIIWIEDASDQDVAFHLGRRRVGILASEAEGFGLPILEYARFGLHILARDIPSFKEINSAGTFYFSSAPELEKSYLKTIGLSQPEPYRSDYSWKSFTSIILSTINSNDQ
jgi:glycosyltransferase involved in cell wall biosynthesis